MSRRPLVPPEIDGPYPEPVAIPWWAVPAAVLIVIFIAGYCLRRLGVL